MPVSSCAARSRASGCCGAAGVVSSRGISRKAIMPLRSSIAWPRTRAATLDIDEVFAAIFRSLRQVVPFDAAAIYLVNPKTLALEQVSDVGYPAGSDEAFHLGVGVGLVGWVAKTGEAVIVPDVRTDSRYVA